METVGMEDFLNYYRKTRAVTDRVVQVIPPDKMDWTYRAGKFTIADLLRHVAAIERTVFAEIAMGRKPAYRGCGRELAEGYGPVITYFQEMHRQTLDILASLPDSALQRDVRTLDGKEVRLGNFLRALIVHEVHHRAVLCIYLNMIGVATPPVIGLREEEVRSLCEKSE